MRRRDHADLRLRRMRTDGKRPAAPWSGARRCTGLASGFMDKPCVLLEGLAPREAIVSKGAPKARGEISGRRRGSGAPAWLTQCASDAASLANLGVLDALGQVEVEVIEVGVVGLRSEHSAEHLAG